jgi:hypothetical protein
MSTGGLTKRQETLLVQLADGALDGRRRARAEASLGAAVDLERALGRQRRVAQALRRGPLPRTDAAPRPLAARGTVRGRVWAASAWAAALATVVLAAIVFVPQAASPTVANAAGLGTLRAERAAPPRRAESPLLSGGLEGVSFPDWGPEFGWHARGSRDDQLAGRETRTVFYAHMSHRVGYTIVAGEPLPLPEGGVDVRVNGVDITLYRDGELDIAVFVRDGLTCVLAGEVLDRATLVRLAAWTADGAIEF